MYVDPKDKIEAIIENGYNFKFGDYISQGFELLQKDLGSFILFAFLSILGMGVIFFIPIVGWFGVPLVLYPVLTAGFYIVAHKLHRGTPLHEGLFAAGMRQGQGTMTYATGEVVSGIWQDGLLATAGNTAAATSEATPPAASGN